MPTGWSGDGPKKLETAEESNGGEPSPSVLSLAKTTVASTSRELSLAYNIEKPSKW